MVGYVIAFSAGVFVGMVAALTDSIVRWRKYKAYYMRNFPDVNRGEK